MTDRQNGREVESRAPVKSVYTVRKHFQRRKKFQDTAFVVFTKTHPLDFSSYATCLALVCVASHKYLINQWMD